jgi:hypothetical protein
VGCHHSCRFWSQFFRRLARRPIQKECPNARQLYVFHEGYGDNGELWCVKSQDRTNWGAVQRIHGVGVSNGCGVTKLNLNA